MKAFWDINPFPNKPWFLRVCSTSLWKTLWEKEKLLVTSTFSFSLSVFYWLGQLSAIFVTIYNCRLQTLAVWKDLKYVVLETVKWKMTKYLQVVHSTSEISTTTTFTTTTVVSVFWLLQKFNTFPSHWCCCFSLYWKRFRKVNEQNIKLYSLILSFLLPIS